MIGFILNITKFASYTPHYYGKLYSLAGSDVDLNNIYSGYYNDSDLSYIFEDLEKQGIILNKDVSEKSLIKNALNKIKDIFDEDLLIVFYENKYSLSRTEYVDNLK